MNDAITIKERILKTLRSDERLWHEGELNQTLLIDWAEHYDETIIDLLFQEELLKKKFFLPIKDTHVFKVNEFRFFLEEHKIDNSYTQYKNRIGLTDGKRFLKDSRDVVLDFPYKDCVLDRRSEHRRGRGYLF